MPAMAMLLVTRPAPILLLGAPQSPGVAIRVKEHERSGRLALLARFATPGALVYSSVFPLVQVGVIVTYPNGSRQVGWPLAIAATAAYLPLYLHHVAWVSRGSRPPAGGWTLLALAVVVAAALPLVGSAWLPVCAVVATSAMLVLPWPRSLLVAGAVVAAQAPLALALDSPLPDAASYYVFSVWWRASSLFMPVWLLRYIRQLEEARRSLAEEAVVRERLRIDGELQRTVGTALELVAARGQRATTLVGGDPEAVTTEVGALVDGSRRALAEARRVINGYQRPSLADEVDAAAALLTAAGVPTRVEVRGEPLPPTTDDPSMRTALRRVAADVLSDGSARACVVTVGFEGGRLRVAVRTDDTEAAAGAGIGAGAGAGAGSGEQARAS